MVKLSKTEIEFCGTKKRFKRCPNKVLRDSNKPVEAIQKEMNELRGEINKKSFQAESKRSEALRLLSFKYDEKKENTKEIQNKNQNKANKLVKEAEKIELELSELSDKVNIELPGFNERMVEAYDQVCVTLLEPMEPGEFIENYDSIDLIIAQNLGMFYDLYMSNTPQAKIDLRLRQLIDAGHDNQIGQFRQE